MNYSALKAAVLVASASGESLGLVRDGIYFAVYQAQGRAWIRFMPSASEAVELTDEVFSQLELCRSKPLRAFQNFFQEDTSANQ